jgi:DNA replication and repair protein RecF
VINKIELYNFRNYQNLNINLGPNLNVLIGLNGQGKTNFVESVNLLLTGEYLRTKNVSELLTLNKTEGFISGEVFEPSQKKSHSYRTVFSFNKKFHFLDEKKISSVQLKLKHPVVVFTPESLSSIKQGPEFRRQLIDEMVTNIKSEAPIIYSHHKKLLMNRNKILRNFKDGLTNLYETESLLKSIEKNYFKMATKLIHLRLAAIREIRPFLKNAATSLFGYDHSPDFKYFISRELVEDLTELQIYQKLVSRANQLHSSELSLGMSLVGPHKHEIEFYFEGQNARNYCSQGQQRALILAFKMAQIVYHRQIFGQHPTLILDDVLSELDEKRSQDLVRFLQEMPTQIFMTTTQIRHIEKNNFPNLKLFEAHAGQLIER